MESFTRFFSKNRRGGGDRVPSSPIAMGEILPLRASGANQKKNRRSAERLRMTPQFDFAMQNQILELPNTSTAAYLRQQSRHAENFYSQIPVLGSGLSGIFTTTVTQ